MGYECGICMNDLDTPVSTPCGHVFCSSCFEAYSANVPDRGRLLCPACRTEIPRRMSAQVSAMLKVPGVGDDLRKHFFPNIRRIYIEHSETKVDTALTDRIDWLMDHTDELQRRLLEAEDEEAGYVQQINKLSAQNATLQTRRRELTDKCAKHKQRRERTQEAVTRAESRIAKLEAEVARRDLALEKAMKLAELVKKLETAARKEVECARAVESSSPATVLPSSKPSEKVAKTGDKRKRATSSQKANKVEG
ncbi:hypothetical protein C8J56DRAFT_1168297 [Mycena floridula]|nr:hypothetical protein C8J56DRAFT_1168297 [Mycena floridula]